MKTLIIIVFVVVVVAVVVIITIVDLGLKVTAVTRQTEVGMDDYTNGSSFFNTEEILLNHLKQLLFVLMTKALFVVK